AVSLRKEDAPLAVGRKMPRQTAAQIAGARIDTRERWCRGREAQAAVHAAVAGGVADLVVAEIQHVRVADGRKSWRRGGRDDCLVIVDWCVAGEERHTRPGSPFVVGEDRVRATRRVEIDRADAPR